MNAAGRAYLFLSPFEIPTSTPGGALFSNFKVYY
jgi:hypothetical protein